MKKNKNKGRNLKYRAIARSFKRAYYNANKDHPVFGLRWVPKQPQPSKKRRYVPTYPPHDGVGL